MILLRPVALLRIIPPTRVRAVLFVEMELVGEVRHLGADVPGFLGVAVIDEFSIAKLPRAIQSRATLFVAIDDQNKVAVTDRGEAAREVLLEWTDHDGWPSEFISHGEAVVHDVGEGSLLDPGEKIDRPLVWCREALLGAYKL